MASILSVNLYGVEVHICFAAVGAPPPAAVSEPNLDCPPAVPVLPYLSATVPFGGYPST